MSTSTAPEVRTFTAAALDAELGRRRNNKRRDTKARAKSWVLAKLSQADVASLKAGEVVVVTGKNAGEVVVGLKGA